MHPPSSALVCSTVLCILHLQHFVLLSGTIIISVSGRGGPSACERACVVCLEHPKSAVFSNPVSGTQAVSYSIFRYSMFRVLQGPYALTALNIARER